MLSVLNFQLTVLRKDLKTIIPLIAEVVWNTVAKEVNDISIIRCKVVNALGSFQLCRGSCRD